MCLAECCTASHESWDSNPRHRKRSITLSFKLNTFLKSGTWTLVFQESYWEMLTTPCCSQELAAPSTLYPLNSNHNSRTTSSRKRSLTSLTRPSLPFRVSRCCVSPLHSSTVVILDLCEWVLSLSPPLHWSTMRNRAHTWFTHNFS